MLTLSSMTITPPEPPMVPQAANESKSMGMSATLHSTVEPSFCLILKVSPQRRILAEEPPGMMALKVRPGSGPPQMSWSNWPRVILPDSIS
ncbi:MAG: hypothetical protein BWX86_02938 [Verrucomicrobia bacterium ADurb.Bin122]|nr:MAG: hypothetical protein BWX86_02938 [Verrucomicrobia bacterium ADurb.Bin122]